MRITSLALLSVINTYASAEDSEQSMWSSPVRKKQRALNAWNQWSKPTNKPVSAWNGEWNWDGNKWNGLGAVAGVLHLPRNRPLGTAHGLQERALLLGVGAGIHGQEMVGVQQLLRMNLP